MDDAERQGRIGELPRIRVLPADTRETIDGRLEALGRAEPITERDILHILDSAAVAISGRPSEGWDGWIAYLLEALDNKTTVEEFHRVLEALQADTAARVVEGHW